MSLNEIKPCAFCGSKNTRVVEVAFKNERVKFVRVKCDGCKAYGPPIIIPVNDLYISDTTRNEAIDAWNKRIVEN